MPASLSTVMVRTWRSDASCLIFIAGRPLHQCLGFVVHGSGHGIAINDHVGMRCARWDHREAVRFVMDAAINDHRTIVVDHGLDAGVEFALTLDADSLP